MRALLAILRVTHTRLSFQPAPLSYVGDEAKLKALQEVSDSFDVSMDTSMEGYSKCSWFRVRN